MSKIALIDVDGHAKKKKWGATIYPNLALCKIARYHKELGDEVEWAEPLFDHYDRIYKSKVFNFSPDDTSCYQADEIIKGGTGYNITSQLPEEIDRLQPDYSIYPHIPTDTAYGFLTRGCPNKCPWCVVPRKEGSIRPYQDVDEIAVNGRTNLILMDNNILAAGEYGLQQLQKIIDRGYRIDFNQAMDARLVNDEIAKMMAQIKWLNYIRFGCDTPGQIAECEKAIDLINGYGYKKEYLLFTMLHGSMEECYNRITYWRGKYNWKVTCFGQPYLDFTTTRQNIPQWQKDMARWCIKKELYKTMDFKDYEPRKGFKCEAYFNPD